MEWAGRTCYAPRRRRGPLRIHNAGEATAEGGAGSAAGGRGCDPGAGCSAPESAVAMRASSVAPAVASPAPRSGAPCATRVSATGACSITSRVGEILETGEGGEEGEVNLADGAIPLLADDDLGLALVRGVGVVHFVAVDEQDHVRVLLDGPALAKVGHHRPLVGAL